MLDVKSDPYSYHHFSGTNLTRDARYETSWHDEPEVEQFKCIHLNAHGSSLGCDYCPAREMVKDLLMRPYRLKYLPISTNLAYRNVFRRLLYRQESLRSIPEILQTS